MNEHDAITLHPLKTPWLMSAVHRYVTRGSLLRLSQVLKLGFFRNTSATVLWNHTYVLQIKRVSHAFSDNVLLCYAFLLIRV